MPEEPQEPSHTPLHPMIVSEQLMLAKQQRHAVEFLLLILGSLGCAAFLVALSALCGSDLALVTLKTMGSCLEHWGGIAAVGCMFLIPSLAMLLMRIESGSMGEFSFDSPPPRELRPAPGTGMSPDEGASLGDLPAMDAAGTGNP